MLYDVLGEMARRGHKCTVGRGYKVNPADVGILHVDATRVEQKYLDLASQFMLSLNFKTADISKRAISRTILSEGDVWSGPVIIKTDLNCWGKSETRHNAIAAKLGRTAPYPENEFTSDYLILPTIGDVGPEIWRNKALVVEKFVPERDGCNYALRTWVFLGRSERCTRHVGSEPIVKGGNIMSRSAVPVPDAIRAERERLGFDYGKFDFVIHEGTPILLDANRTPGSSPLLRTFLQEGSKNLAAGLHDLIVESGVDA